LDSTAYWWDRCTRKTFTKGEMLLGIASVQRALQSTLFSADKMKIDWVVCFFSINQISVKLSFGSCTCPPHSLLFSFEKNPPDVSHFVLKFVQLPISTRIPTVLYSRGGGNNILGRLIHSPLFCCNFKFNFHFPWWSWSKIDVFSINFQEWMEGMNRKH